MEGIYIWNNKHTERHTRGGNIHMEGHTQRDIHTERHTRWYIHMMGLTHGGTHTLRRCTHEGPYPRRDTHTEGIYA